MFWPPLLVDTGQCVLSSPRLGAWILLGPCSDLLVTPLQALFTQEASMQGGEEHMERERMTMSRKSSRPPSLPWAPSGVHV